MPAFVLHGDKIVFEASFGAAKVIAPPGVMIASGKGKCGGPPVCVVGDEANVIVMGCVYTTTQHTIAGTGMITIESLDGGQKAAKVKSGGKALILATGKCNAKFQVLVQAQQPTVPPVLDATPSYSGKGEFQSMNQRGKAT
jgi:hypothetical protein